MDEETVMAAFQARLAAARNITVVAGAGLSAASGIPTFRGAGGLWRKYDAMSLATPQAFRSNPSRSWAFYEYRRQKAVAARPNEAHYALAKFALPTLRKSIAPSCESFTIITQNVDGLSVRAAAEVHSQFEESEPSTPLLELHGSVLRPYCTDCRHERLVPGPEPLVPSLANIVDEVEKGLDEVDIPLEQLPRCSECHGLMRPGVVWFGETPRHLSKIAEILSKTDLMLVVGTSSVVYPAAGFADDVRDAGGQVAVFNIEPSPGDDEADFLFYGPCEEILPQALGMHSLVL